MRPLTHPLIETSANTCSSNPEQYEGRLTDGRWFYFRYRFGRADLGFGPDIDTAVDDSLNHRLPIGGRYQGEFDDVDQRDAVFARLAADMGG